MTTTTIDEFLIASIVDDVSTWCQRIVASRDVQAAGLVARISEALEPLLRDAPSSWHLHAEAGRLSLHRDGVPDAVAAVEVTVASYGVAEGPGLMIRRPGERWDPDARYYAGEIAERAARELVTAAPEAWMAPGALRAAEWLAGVYGLWVSPGYGHCDVPGGRRAQLDRYGWMVIVEEVVTGQGRLYYRVLDSWDHALGIATTASYAIDIVLDDLALYRRRHAIAREEA